MCTGDGIYEYVCQVLESNCYSGASRMLDLRIGGQENGHFGVPTFYSVVVDLLRCLSEISEEDFGAVRNRQKFEVFLSHPYHSRVSKQWSLRYMRQELRPLMVRVSEMHPSVMVNASVNEVSGDSFSKIDMFTMSWRPEDKSRDMFWETEEDEYYTEDAPSDQQMPQELLSLFQGAPNDDELMPQEMLNFFQEILGFTGQDEGGDSSGGDDDVDVEDNNEDDIWGF